MSWRRTCPECGEGFQTRQPSATYCSRECKTNAANLEAARGKKLYRLAYHWRKGKGSGVKFSDLSWMVDEFIREDKKAGRPAPPQGETGLQLAANHHTARARALAKQKEE